MPEKTNEDCRDLIYQIIQEDLEIDMAYIRFHAIHRVGRKVTGKTRPIIAHFVCREDIDWVWSKRSKIKHSSSYRDANIT